MRRPRDLRYAGAACLIIAAALALRWPVLHTGFIIDDFAQLAMLRGQYSLPRPPWSLFTFVDGSVIENELLRASGFFPWWSHPELRVALFRPLSSVLMWCDLQLFGDNPFLYHLHSAFWWLLMLLLLAAVLRKLLPPLAAGAALLLCCAHASHVTLLGWIANRNAMVASSFGLLALLLQLGAVSRPSLARRSAVLLAYALALCAGEYALGYIVYGVVYELCAADSWRERIRRALLPFGGLLVLYGIVRVLGGYGARHSGMYIDPVLDPLAFVSGALVRLPVLAADLVFSVRSSWWSSGLPWASQLAFHGVIPARWASDLRPMRALIVAIGCLALCVFAAVSVKLRATRSESPTRAASGPSSFADLRFISYSVPLSLVPALGVFPESRLLLPGLFGWSVLLCRLWLQESARLRALGRSPARLSVCAAVALCWLVGVIAPPLYVANEVTDLPRMAHAVRASIRDPALDPVLRQAESTLLLGAIDPTTTIYIPMIRRYYERPGPPSCHLLMSGDAPLRLTRLSDNSFVLERMLSRYTALDAYGSAFNGEPLAVGQHYRAGMLNVTIEAVAEGRPLRARYQLDVPLDHPSVALLAQTEVGLRRVTFPAVGQTVILAGPAPPLAFVAR